MGICKCKNTTGLYCFTHDCHVCERCVAGEDGEHQKCYVRKYVDYINNSAFTPPVCGHCHKLDVDGAPSPLVRLPCLDVVHLGCLDAVGVEATSAQNPVKCPLCGADVFPKGATKASPIMAALCRALKDSPWAAALVAGVPNAAPEVPHARVSVPKAIEVPIPPVSNTSVLLPPPPSSSPSSLSFNTLSGDETQIELNVTREDDSPAYVLENTGIAGGMSTRKNVGGRGGDYSVTDAIERMEEDEYEDEKYHDHTCSQILYYFGIGRESNGQVTIDYTKVLFVLAIIGILFYLVSLANRGQETEPDPDATTN